MNNLEIGNERIVRREELVALVGLSYSTICRLEHDGRFPRRLRLGGRAVGWRLSEVLDWIANRPAADVGGGVR